MAYKRKYNDKLALYKIKRFYCFMDEWLFYFLLVVLYKLDVSLYIYTFIVLFGSSTIITCYKNLDIIEKKIFNEKQWFLWPIN
jgi:hypothetical protein